MEHIFVLIKIRSFSEEIKWKKQKNPILLLLKWRLKKIIIMKKYITNTPRTSPEQTESNATFTPTEPFKNLARTYVVIPQRNRWRNSVVIPSFLFPFFYFIFRQLNHSSSLISLNPRQCFLLAHLKSSLTYANSFNDGT